MNVGVKQIFRSIHFALGFHAVKSPKGTSELSALIRRLRPLDCGVEMIRVGGANDGGYLVPNDLDGIEYCFSPGVSCESSFENQLAERNIKSFLADYSVEAPPIIRPEFVFDRKYLGAVDRDQFFTLASWKNKYLGEYRRDLILQMDIEGFEYEVILSTPSDLLDQFRIIVIEFHELDRLFDPLVFNLFSSCFNKLLELFYVAHLHPNNCAEVVRRGEIEIPRIMEFTFFNKRRVAETQPQSQFPHELDADNTPRPPVPLPKCWYASAVNGIIAEADK